MKLLLRCCLILAACRLTGCQSPEEPDIPTEAEQVAIVEPVAVDVDQLRAPVEAFCGNCHASPPPTSFPKEAWRFEVERGFDFYVESFRDDLTPPPLEDVVAYYEQLSPEQLIVEAREPLATEKPAFEFRKTLSPSPDLEPPAVSFIRHLRLTRDADPQPVFCDMRSGEIRVLSKPAPDPQSTLLATCAFPAHIESCDLDGDGTLEMIVAELGSANSADHSDGAVIWLQPTSEGWRQRLLRSGLGRVADVRPADFDGDGDSDLLVAEFGHFRTGRILLLENEGLTDGTPRFREHVLDPRHGASHIPVADLNDDGHLDFVALISQEHETVDAFLNDGTGKFRREPIFQGNDPSFGSSGIQLVDMDGDGDLDVLYSNGDTFGSQHLKPYHAVHWLDNRGTYPFEDRVLAPMVGVQKALAGDLDGDGDQDVVAVGLMPRNLLLSPELQQHGAVVMLEQTTPGNFVRFEIERGQFYHAGLELADMDRDGDLDVIVGNMYPQVAPIQPWLTIWSNLGKAERR